ncbi:MAG: hypothetical protein QXN05_02075 [Acidilobaceae archaeon]
MLGTTHISRPDVRVLDKALEEVDHIVLEGITLEFESMSFLDRIAALPLVLAFYFYVLLLRTFIWIKECFFLVVYGKATFYGDQFVEIYVKRRAWK